MEFLDFNLYRPTDLEIWINDIYQSDGISTPSDLEDLDRVSSLFHAHVAYTEGETKVIYDEDGDCIVFLHIYMEPFEQRLAFFHELCHPAMHSGNQSSLHPSFVALQETQAGLFQQYAAMPAFMLEHYQNQAQSLDHRGLAEAFKLPAGFALDRLERIKRRMNQERIDRRLRDRLAAAAAPALQSEAANRLLAQLRRQVGKEQSP